MCLSLGFLVLILTHLPWTLSVYPRLHFTAGFGFVGNGIDGTGSISSEVGTVSTDGNPAVVNVIVAPVASP
jgi:hypothetical protein